MRTGAAVMLLAGAAVVGVVTVVIRVWPDFRAAVEEEQSGWAVSNPTTPNETEAR